MSKFELLCQLKAISSYAYDIHYSAEGKNFYSDHIFSERLADVDVEDDYIETMYLGESEDAPSSKEINDRVALITPDIVDDIDFNFKSLRDMIVIALMMIQKYDYKTKAEEDLLGSVAHVLQRHNGLLFRQLKYTPEEIRNSDDDIDYWFSTKSGAHIPVKKGQSREEAMKSFFEKKEKGGSSGKADDNPNSWTRKEAKEYWDKNKEDDPDGMLYRFKSFEDFYKAGVESGDIKEEKSDTDKKEPEKKKDESKKEEIPQQRTPNKTPAGEDVKWKFDDGKYSTQLSSGAKLTIEWKKPVDEYMSPWRYKIEYKGDTWYGGEESKDVAQIVAIDTAERAAGKIKAHYTDWRSLERERRRIDHFMS